MIITWDVPFKPRAFALESNVLIKYQEARLQQKDDECNVENSASI